MVSIAKSSGMRAKRPSFRQCRLRGPDQDWASMGCAPSVESTAEFGFPVLDRARKRPRIRACEPEAFRSCKILPECASKKQGSRAEIRERCLTCLSRSSSPRRSSPAAASGSFTGRAAVHCSPRRRAPFSFWSRILGEWNCFVSGLRGF